MEMGWMWQDLKYLLESKIARSFLLDRKSSRIFSSETSTSLLKLLPIKKQEINNDIEKRSKKFHSWIEKERTSKGYCL